MATIRIDIEVPDRVVAAGAARLFAECYGWTEQVDVLNEDGIPTGATIPNPVSAVDFCRNVIRDLFSRTVKAKYIEKQKRLAESQASQDFEALSTP